MQQLKMQQFHTVNNNLSSIGIMHLSGNYHPASRGLFWKSKGDTEHVGESPCQETSLSTSLPTLYGKLDIKDDSNNSRKARPLTKQTHPYAKELAKEPAVITVDETMVRYVGKSMTLCISRTPRHYG